jgi:hypothetical protein
MLFYGRFITATIFRLLGSTHGLQNFEKLISYLNQSNVDFDNTHYSLSLRLVRRCSTACKAC